MTASQPLLDARRTSRAAPTAHAKSNPIASPHLEHIAAAIQRSASQRGLALEFLGLEPLFTKPRLYGEGHAPWVLCPASSDPMVAAGLPIPSRQRRQLTAFVNAGMDFRHVYLAHEIAERSVHRARRPVLDHFRTLSDLEAEQLIARPEAPAATRRTARRIDQVARACGRGLATTAAAVAAAPLVLLDGLDPAVLGAVTLLEARDKPHAPAAWFLLAHWDW